MTKFHDSFCRWQFLRHQSYKQLHSKAVFITWWKHEETGGRTECMTHCVNILPLAALVALFVNPKAAQEVLME